VPDRGLIRFRFDFDYGRSPAGITTWNPGPPWCGVTAFDLEDAMALVQTTLFPGKRLPRIARVTEDVDVSAITDWPIPLHDPPIWRGVWFPPSN
jgi:hypothetical protein